MKFGVLALVVGCGVLTRVTVAAAGEPPARRGFQMALRTGYSVPMGSLAGSEQGDGAAKLSDYSSGQVPIFADIGGKVIPELFLGGYLGLGFGGAGQRFDDLCRAAGETCVGVSLHLGIEAQYHILPANFANPWLGYGIGIESLAISGSNGDSDSIGFGGVEFARLMAGVDFRLNRVFGVGPFVDFSAGRYSTAHVNSQDQDITNRATHSWLTLGVRFVFFP